MKKIRYKFTALQVCQISPNRIITENRDKILEFVRKIETFNDSTVSARLINILVPPLCHVDLDYEVCTRLFIRAEIIEAIG